MALLAITHQLFVDGAWTTYPAYSEDSWSIQAGPDVSSGARPNRLQLTWQNPNLSMDPSRPDSPLYGKAGRQTPVRIQINGVNVSQGEASDWQPDRTVDHTVTPAAGRSWVDFTAEGVLHRLALWTDPIQSAMARQISSYINVNGMLGYSRLEDDSTATSLSQDIQGVRPGSFTGGVALAGNPGPGGSDSCISLGSDGAFTTYFKNSTTAGYQLCFAAKLAAVPGSATFQTLARWVDTRGRVWTWQINNTTYQWLINDVDGTLLGSAAAGGAGVPLNSWIRYRLKLTVSGSTYTVEPAWYLENDASPTGITFTFTGGTTTGQVKTFGATANGASYLNGASFCHVFSVTDQTLDLINYGVGNQAFNGYKGDTPGARWSRLLTERGIAVGLLGTSVGPPMGAQKPGILIQLLQECVDTDGGLMYDSTVGAIGVVFATRDSLTNKTPALNLTRSQLDPPFRRRLDNVGKQNVITANNAAGERQVVRLDTGAMSTQPPPAGISELKGSIDVNLADPITDLFNRAMLELNRGTLDRVRYDSLTIDLTNDTALQDAVSNMRPGDWIRVTGEEADPLTLVAISWQRTGSAVRDKVTFACLPADTAQVAVIDDTAAIIDSSSSTLSAAITSTATTFVISTYDPVEVWSRTASFDLMLAGERIGVPAAGVGVVSGTGPYLQTVTGAVRSKNGIVKAQLINTEIHVADGVRIF